MQEAIDEQNRKEQEIINRINQEKTNRDAEVTRNIQERKRLQEQIDSQQEKIRKELIEQQNQISKGKINSSSQEKIDELKRELTEKEQELEEHIRQSEEKRNLAQQKLYTYIEQRKN
jgi:hypothetical protein